MTKFTIIDHGVYGKTPDRELYNFWYEYSSAEMDARGATVQADRPVDTDGDVVFSAVTVILGSEGYLLDLSSAIGMCLGGAPDVEVTFEDLVSLAKRMLSSDRWTIGELKLMGFEYC